MHSLAIFGLVAMLTTFNLWATRLILIDTASFPAQKAGQLLLVWCLPVAGALLAICILRDEPDKASGRYPRRGDPGDAMEALQDGLSGPDTGDQ